MELRNVNGEKKRRRKMVSRGPVLVRSVKAGQVASASYGNEDKAAAGLWKSA